MSVASTIEHKLRTGLAPAHLEVIDESANHAVPRGSESHFKAVVVSARFDGKRTLHRHRMVYALLADELAGPVHALALHTYTEDEWREVRASPCSPLCKGGSKAEAKAKAAAEAADSEPEEVGSV